MTMPAPLVRNVADFLRPASIWDLAHLARAEADQVLAGRLATFKAASAVSYAADVSEFQGPLTSAYPWRGVIFRVGEGDYHKDTRFDVNYAAAKTLMAQGHLDWFGVYHVGIKPGINGVRSITSQVDAINSWIGGPLHGGGIIMQDAENWSGLQGGNMSGLFNGILEGCVNLVLGGDERRTLGYGNGSDWANLWPDRPSWLKRTVASWGTSWPGTFGWQFRGGTATPVAGGYPTTVAPWGAVDLNAFVGLTSKDVAAAFGIGADMALDLNDPVVKAIRADIAAVPGKVRTTIDPDLLRLAQWLSGAGNSLFNPTTLPGFTSPGTVLATVVKAIANIGAGQVDEAKLTQDLLAGGLPEQLATDLASHLTLVAK